MDRFTIRNRYQSYNPNAVTLLDVIETLSPMEGVYWTLPLVQVGSEVVIKSFPIWNNEVLQSMQQQIKQIQIWNVWFQNSRRKSVSSWGCIFKESLDAIIPIKHWLLESPQDAVKIIGDNCSMWDYAWKD
jgi:hypothetical protein